MPMPIDAPPGLEGIVAAETAIGDVRGDEGYFHYRGHDWGKGLGSPYEIGCNGAGCKS